MLKRSYEKPACVVVVLGTTNHMLQASTLSINRDSGTSISSSSQILVKEDNATTDVDLWDEEW